MALLGTAYAMWTIWGAGIETVAWGLLLLAIGVPVYLATRRAGNPRP